jgi:hypothetical protein
VPRTDNTSARRCVRHCPLCIGIQKGYRNKLQGHYIFKKNEGKSFAISINIEGVYKKLKGFTYKPTLPASIHPNHFAPAITQSLASHVILSSITNVDESLCLKILAFLSSHIIHTVSKVREVNPFR